MCASPRAMRRHRGSASGSGPSCCACRGVAWKASVEAAGIERERSGRRVGPWSGGVCLRLACPSRAHGLDAFCNLARIRYTSSPDAVARAFVKAQKAGIQGNGRATPFPPALCATPKRARSRVTSSICARSSAGRAVDF